MGNPLSKINQDQKFHSQLAKNNNVIMTKGLFNYSLI